LREKKSAREKIPVNFLLFTGKPGFAPSQVVPPVSGAWPPQRVPLDAPTPGDCGRHLLAAVLVELRNQFLRFCANKANFCANKANRQNGSESNVWR
jgi:hypothetical protein